MESECVAVEGRLQNRYKGNCNSGWSVLAGFLNRARTRSDEVVVTSNSQRGPGAGQLAQPSTRTWGINYYYYYYLGT
jgi:hypothetical protein